MKRRVAISAGHSNVPGQDMGAKGNLLTEGSEAVILRNLIVDRFKERNEVISIDPDNSVTGKTVALFKQYFNANDIVVDIHFNASSNPTATGCEVLVPAVASATELEIAGTLALDISKVLGIKNRGVKTELQSARKKLLWMTIPGENILIEICFISNDEDVRKYITNKEQLAKSIADVLIFYKNM